MAKITCVILGLLVAAMGIIELIDVTFDLTYIYFGVIAIGIIGVLVGIYARQGGKTDVRLPTENAALKKDVEHLRKQLTAENENVARQAKELEKLTKELEKEQAVTEQLNKKIEERKIAEEAAKVATKEAKKEAKKE